MFVREVLEMFNRGGRATLKTGCVSPSAEVPAQIKEEKAVGDQHLFSLLPDFTHHVTSFLIS